MNKVTEDERLTVYRQEVVWANFVAGLRVLCGLLGLFALFMLALLAFLGGRGGGLFAGGVLSALWRFGKAAFWLACTWGFLEAWSDYAERQEKESKRRTETLASMEQDPDWWRRWESK